MRLFKLLREADKKVFIVTNSLWDYTNVVMEYLCDTPDWLSYFDVVISGSSKPSFFRLDRPNPIFEIHTPTGEWRLSSLVYLLMSRKKKKVYFAYMQLASSGQ